MQTGLNCPKCGGEIQCFRAENLLAYMLVCRPCKARWLFDVYDWVDLFESAHGKDQLQRIIDSTAPIEEMVTATG